MRFADYPLHQGLLGVVARAVWEAMLDVDHQKHQDHLGVVALGVWEVRSVDHR